MTVVGVSVAVPSRVPRPGVPPSAPTNTITTEAGVSITTEGGVEKTTEAG